MFRQKNTKTFIFAKKLNYSIFLMIAYLRLRQYLNISKQINKRSHEWTKRKKRFYFSFFTIIRNNDVEKMRIHMKKKIIHIWTKIKILKQSFEQYLYDEIQKRFCFYYWNSNNWFINMNTIIKMFSNQNSFDSKSIDWNYWIRYYVFYRFIALSY